MAHGITVEEAKQRVRDAMNALKLVDPAIDWVFADGTT
jgi:hypothetical protein